MLNEEAGFKVKDDKQDKDPEDGFVFLAIEKSLQAKGPLFAFSVRDQAGDHGRHPLAIIAVSTFEFG